MIVACQAATRGAGGAGRGGIEAVAGPCGDMLKLKTDSIGMGNTRGALRRASSHLWADWGRDLSASWGKLSGPFC